MSITQPTLPAIGHEGAAAPPMIGRVIDERYKIIELLGEGGMGAVYVAEQVRLRKQFALKTIRAEFAAHSQAEARFAREAMATAQLDHPHVASAIDYGPLPEGGAYLVTQLVRGISLGKRLDQGPLSWQEACQLGAQVADALAAAHAVGIVHRDLKPDNILLESRNDGSLHARVVDFGIARVSGEHGGAVADASQPITRMGAVIGTPGYMAPEQAVGQQVDLRVDLYALGVILWECCAGRQLFRADSLTELFAAQLSRPAPSLRDVIPGHVPEDLSVMVDRLLARKPSERPDTAATVRDELRRIGFAGASLSAALPAVSTPRGPITETAHDVTMVANPTIAGTLPTGAAAGRPKLPRALWFGLGGLVAVLLLVSLLTGDDEADADGDRPERIGRADAGDSKPARRGRGAPPTIDELVAEVPERYRQEAKILLTSENEQARELAGETIAEAPEADKPAIPEYVRNVAWFEKVDSCDARKSILAKIDGAGDTRALAPLKIIAATPTDTCRQWFARYDCLGCLRDELTRVIARFEAETQR
jgi:tRNA A-37 threonylcarbamoyl transferase component Bud32